MTLEPKRPRPGGSRTPTGRPKKVASRLEPAPAVEETGGGFETVASATSSTTDEAASATSSTTDETPDPVVEEDASMPVSRPPRRTTYALAAVVAILALVGVGEIVYLTHDPTPTVSSSRPVVTGEIDHRTAVEAAANATEQILSTSYQDYDHQVTQATSKMTDTFAKEYRGTADGLKDKYAAQHLKLTVQAVAQGVVQASPSQVKALLFLNQYVEKVVDGKPQTAYAQYRALVTVVHTDQGWLVSNIETQ